jgi:hypothetical protein
MEVGQGILKQTKKKQNENNLSARYKLELAYSRV